MTITNTTPRNAYTGDNSTTSFTYNFKVLVAVDLKIFLDAVEQVSGFTVTGIGGDTGGNVVFTTPPASSVAVTLERFTITDRTVDFIEGGPLAAQVLDDDQDRAIAMIQESVLRTINTSNVSGEIVWDFEDQRGINLADPVGSNDVVNRQWAETAMTSQLQIATSAANIASAAAVSASNSASSSLASENSASSFAVSASNSASAADVSASIACVKSAEASTFAVNASNSASAAAVDASNVASAIAAFGSIITSGSNLGGGEGVFVSATGGLSVYKSFVAGSGMQVTSTATEITYTSLADASLAASVAANSSTIVVLTASTAANASSIVVISASLTAFEAATASNFVVTNASVAANASAIVVLEASSLFSLTNAGGTGETLVVGASNNTGRIKSIAAGDNVVLTVGASTLTISAVIPGGAGEANTGSNLGVGEPIFVAKSALDFTYNTIGAGNNVTISPASAGTVRVNAPSAVTTTSALSASGVELITGASAANVTHLPIAGIDNINIVSSGSQVTISGSLLALQTDHASTAAVALDNASAITVLENNLIGIISTNVSFEASLLTANRLIRMNTASAINITVPPHASVAHAEGTQIGFRNNGVGSVHFVAGSTNVTINASVLSLRGRFSTATLLFAASTSGGDWDLTGDLPNT